MRKTIESLLKKYKSCPLQVRATFWFLICSFLQRGISVVTTPIFTRIMTAAEYGEYAVFNSWLGIITIFVSLRLYYGVYAQGIVKYEDNKAVFSSSMQGLLFTLVLAWTLIYLMFQKFWNALFSLTTAQMLAMFVMIWATGAFSFWATEQRTVFKYRNLVVITLLVSFAKPVVGIVLVLNSADKVTARILGLALVELIGYVGTFFVQMHRGKKFYSKRYWKYALAFNIPLIPHYLSQTVLNSADRIMIKSLVGATEAGVYGLAYSVSQIMLLFNQALLQTLTPWIYKKIKAHEEKDISRISYIALVLIATVNIILIAFAPETVKIFAPSSYSDAIWVIPPVAMSVYFIFAYSLFACFEFYFEKTKFIAIASISGAVLNVVLNYFCINMFGYYAAGYTTLICYVVYAVGHYAFMQVVCKEKCMHSNVYNVKVLLGISVAFLVVGFLLLVTYNAPAIRYGIIAFSVVMAILKREKLSEYFVAILAIRKRK